VVKQTKPPARYNEGALIKAMKNAHQFVTDVNLKKILRGDEGIGTSATRANIIVIHKITVQDCMGFELALRGPKFNIL
jgi:DNA topoisomerase IA